MSNMSRERKLPEPEKGGKPKRIKTKNPPGGPHTPGAKGTYPKQDTGASVQDEVKHTTLTNRSGNKENKT